MYSWEFEFLLGLKLSNTKLRILHQVKGIQSNPLHLLNLTGLLLLEVASLTTSTRTITVSCSPARLTDIDNKLHDSSLLAKQSPTATRFLSANLIISKGPIFHIDSTDTKWLKINSKVDRSGGPKIGPAYTGVLHNL